MAIDRPKILTRLTVPAGGWTLQLNAENGVNDITISASIAAGDYYVAWDQQSDDFLWKVCDAVNTAYDTASVPVNAQDETSYDNSPATEGTFAGGAGHAASDVITLSDGTTVTVDAVSGGAVTQFTVDSSASTGSVDEGDTLTQTSTTGGGTGFSLTIDEDNMVLKKWASATTGMTASIDSDHKVNLGFLGTYFGSSPGREIKIEWTQQDGDEVAKVLGFDYSSDDTLTGSNNPTITADYHHAYGWYADHDGALEFLGIEPQDVPSMQQSIAPSGHSKVQYLGSRFENELRLGFLPSGKTWSGDTKYGSSPPYPYNQNEGLESWFKEARKGVEFRVYRQNIIDTAGANEKGSATGDTATTITDSGKSWTVNEHSGSLLFVDTDSGASTLNIRYYIESNTATVITVNAKEPPSTIILDPVGDQVYYIFTQTYDTYVVNLNSMGGFKPTEIPDIDKFNIRIPLIRYES